MERTEDVERGLGLIPALGEVMPEEADVGFANRRDEVMFAGRIQWYVPEEDQVPAIASGEVFFQMLGRVFGESGEEVGVGVGDAAGGFEESLPLGVLAYGRKDFAHRPLDARPVYSAPFRHHSGQIS